ncbi:hypothetical protein E1200_16475 [Actinomadura sp. GC306]|uniref:hypothetical protein n=1 Tax=Actinomadura sp. GC306 TaxID=2530367 RepID=UPI00104F9EFA|nr:hypothetical protein [Actinomadura sp. GC306]TDC66571.1 hypothetical protein E1200_16475 [Actinomadura sp. GC306]
MTPPKSADPERIAAHGKDIASIVVPRLTTAGNTLNGDGVGNMEGGDFSITCTNASVAYPIAVQFAFEDIKLLMNTAQSYAKTIDATAKTYAKVEQANTV